MSEAASIRAALRWARGALEATCESPALDAELLLAHVLGCARYLVHAHGERELTRAETQGFEALVERTRRGEPLAYLLGVKEFWSLAIRVTPAVLIPRPETELLVELALARLPEGEPRKVADLGTGSGALALAIAHERRACEMIATDVDPAALSVASANVRRLGLANVRLVAADWLRASAPGQLDLIVSNPPYVARDDPHLAAPALRYEPRRALVSDRTGLAAIGRIIADAAPALRPRGTLIVEHGGDQAAAVRALLAAHGFIDIESHRDLAGHERATSGKAP